jgi:hypothetical protein
MALNVTIEKRPNSILLVVMIIMAIGIYMAIISVHALITDSQYEGILVMESMDSITTAIISTVLAVIFFILGYTLWKMVSISRIIILSFAGLGAVLYPLRGLVLASEMTQKGHEITGGEVISSILTVLGIIISIFTLLILSRQDVILAFEANEMVRIKKLLGFLKEKMEIGRKRCNEGEITKAELSKLRSECLAEERVLKGRIRHFEKVRLVRERKIKERLEKKEKAKEERIKSRQEKKEEKEERKAKKEEEDHEESEESENVEKKQKPKKKK